MKTLLLLSLVLLIAVPEATSDCPNKVNCFIDPCSTAECPAYPAAICKANYCGGCNAEFYLNSVRVQCGSNCKTKKEETCKFPMKYKGVIYNACTKKDHNRHWCATQLKADGSYAKWGDCDPDRACSDSSSEIGGDGDKSGGHLGREGRDKRPDGKMPLPNRTGKGPAPMKRLGLKPPHHPGNKGPGHMKHQSDKIHSKHHGHPFPFMLGGKLLNFTGALKKMADGKWKKIDPISTKDQLFEGVKEVKKAFTEAKKKVGPIRFLMGKHKKDLDDDGVGKKHHDEKWGKRHDGKKHHVDGKGKHHGDDDDHHDGRKKHHKDGHKKGRHYEHDKKHHHGKRHGKRDHHKKSKHTILAVVITGSVLLVVMLAIGIALYCKKRNSPKSTVVQFTPDKSAANPVFEQEIPVPPPMNVAPPIYHEKEVRPPSPSHSLPPTYSHTELRQVVGPDVQPVVPSLLSEERPTDTPLPNVDC